MIADYMTNDHVHWSYPNSCQWDVYFKSCLNWQYVNPFLFFAGQIVSFFAGEIFDLSIRVSWWLNLAKSLQNCLHDHSHKIPYKSHSNTIFPMDSSNFPRVPRGTIEPSPESVPAWHLGAPLGRRAHWRPQGPWRSQRRPPSPRRWPAEKVGIC